MRGRRDHQAGNHTTAKVFNLPEARSDRQRYVIYDCCKAITLIELRGILMQGLTYPVTKPCAKTSEKAMGFRESMIPCHDDDRS